jgi:hypothetical protein
MLAHDRCVEAITFPDGGVTPRGLLMSTLVWISFYTAYL